ncbi:MULTISPECIES: hypothetical protein [unclassified Paraburkholderia]|uniref:hypothetical protein n=1 Tax=unclassified Paraburkholderia TaxID=2615204 RepID=UPI000CFDFD44|nr:MULTISPECIES: hypothetical protein [unclassified Paraburkholderia]
MEVPDRATAVSSDGCAVVSLLSVRGREVEGTVSRDALEEHFSVGQNGFAGRRTLFYFQLPANIIRSQQPHAMLVTGADRQV